MTTVLRRSLVAFATALALVAIAVVPGMASATFSAPVDLSAPLRDADRPQVAVGPDGATTITWARYNGDNTIIQARTRPAEGGDFGGVVNLSEDGQNAVNPQVAVGADGATTITWSRYNEASPCCSIIQARTRPAGQTNFGGVVNLSASGQNADSPQVAVGPDGATTITWSRSGGENNYIIQARTRPAEGGDFGGVVDLSELGYGQQAFTPQVAVGPDGATTITWKRSNPAFEEIIQARTRPAEGGAFGAIVHLAGASGNPAYNPQVAVGPDGATTITWSRWNPSFSIIQARTRPAEGGDFSAPVDLSASGRNAEYPQVAVGADGATTITWTRGGIIEASTRPAEGGAFGGVVNLSASGQNAVNPQVAVGANGAITITWQRSNDDNTIIQARTRPAGSGDFGGVVNLSENGQNAVNPQVAVGPDGATTITWQRSNGTNIIIQASSGEATLARLSVTTDGSGAGSVTSAPAGINCGATCGAYFAIGSSVTLTATAAGGSSFTGWSGSGCSGTSTCTVTMSEARAVTAEFAVVPPGQFDLMVTKSGTGAGTVTSSPAGINCGSDCSETLPSGTSVTLTAAPAAGSSFTAWSGSGCSGTSTCTVVMSEARAVTAQFTKLQPSNVFPTPKVKAGARALVSTVRVPGRGTLTQRVTRSSNLAAVLTVCKTSGKATKAGWVKLTCKLSAATRKALRKRSLRVSVKTTFTPTGGLPASKTQAVTLKSQRPPPYTG